MKKTKRVLSYMMLLVPLALPAGCSPVSTSAGSRTSNGNDQQAGADEAEQLRLIVEKYFEQQERQRQLQRQLEVSSPQIVSENEKEMAGEPALVGSEEELKEELDELGKTGAWTAEDKDNGQAAAQCQLPGTGVIEAPVRPEPPLVSGPLPQPAEPAAAKPGARRTACDFPVLVNNQVQFYLNLFQGKQRKNFQRWLERSTMYLPQITAELEKAGLPLELAWLAMIESGFNPSAYSPAHASGLWQFIPGTAQNYGLRIDSWADERRDPEKSTKAAVAYLKALHKHFGDWHLAVAAYNAGEGTVERGLKQYKANNFWELAQHDALRLETKRYVPQMIATVLITRNPEQYGFRNVQYKRPAQHELVRVPSGIDLKTVAASASVSVEQLRSLNNDLLKDEVPAGGKGWLLKVPAGRAALVAANLPKAQAVAVARVAAPAEYLSHKVAKNETLQDISKKYDVSLTALLKINDLRSSKLLAGQQLRIPTTAAPSSPGLILAKSEAAPASGEKITHKLDKGETLSEVAEQYGVPLASLMQWNQISKAGKVRAGQQLTVYAAEDKAQLAAAPAPAAEAVSAAGEVVELTAAVGKRRPDEAAAEPAAAAEKKEEKGAVVLLSGSKKQPSTAAEAVSYYKVRSGDSLWSISKKLQVSAKEIKTWNSLNSGSLQVGATLVIRKG
ncbi:MAG: LysM peptidoglycan-binding domain-containing protein [Candidatus Electronema sp. VV]